MRCHRFAAPLLTLVAFVSTAACGTAKQVANPQPSPIHAPTPSPASSLTATGTYTVMLGPRHDQHFTADQVGLGKPCFTLGSFTDILQGAQVVVLGDGNRTLGVGSLKEPAQAHGGCSFMFSIPDVDGASAFYTVTVNGRPGKQFTHKQMFGILAMTVGD